VDKDGYEDEDEDEENQENENKKKNVGNQVGDEEENKDSKESDKEQVNDENINGVEYGKDNDSNEDFENEKNKVGDGFLNDGGEKSLWSQPIEGHNQEDQDKIKTKDGDENEVDTKMEDGNSDLSEDSNKEENEIDYDPAGDATEEIFDNGNQNGVDSGLLDESQKFKGDKNDMPKNENGITSGESMVTPLLGYDGNGQPSTATSLSGISGHDYDGESTGFFVLLLFFAMLGVGALYFCRRRGRNYSGYKRATYSSGNNEFTFNKHN